MAPAPVEHLIADLSRLAPPAVVRREARARGALQRQGAVDVYALLVTTLLGVAIRGRVSVAELRRVYGETTGRVVARSSFYDRFNEGFASLMRWLLERLMEDSRRSPARLPGPLSFFTDILAEDATIAKLDDRMADDWPGPRTNSSPAALKVHGRVRVMTGEPVKVRVTHGRKADCKAFGIGHELRGTLLLFDQGYSSPSLWRRVQSVGGYFITRLPVDRDPVILAMLRRHRGRARKVVGKTLRVALQGLKRQVLDVECSFSCRVRRYNAAKGRRVEEGFRVVAVFNKAAGAWHTYVTNVPPHVLDGELVARTYRLRWEVEQFFKTTKTGSGLSEVASANENVVLTMVYAAIIRATLSMRGRLRAQALLGFTRRSFLQLRSWHSTWLRHARDALQGLLPDAPPLEAEAFLRLCSDANPKRWCTLLSFEGVSG